MRLPFTAVCLLCALGTLAVATADAQPLGTFRWQLQPFCNVVVVNVTQQGANYQVDGFDDQCGAAQRAPLVGLATPNPDGSIGFGLNIVTAPGGRDVHVDARISLPGLGGTWSDSAGNSGTFAFAINAGGAPRPPARVGALAVNAAQVQLRVVEACVTGQVIQAINQDGSVSCGPGFKSAPNGGLDASNGGGLVASDALLSAGSLAVEGPGKRFLWYPGKAALRAGLVTGAQWDDVNIGGSSVAAGVNTIASGSAATALGNGSVSSGTASTALGSTTASGGFSLSAGRDTVASGGESVALGFSTLASGSAAIALGRLSVAAGDSSVVLGSRAVTTAAADGSFVFSDRASNNDFTSFTPNQFVVRSAGGVGFYTNAATTTGVELAPGGSSWASLSDVNAKENFRDVDGEDVLAKLAAMSIQEWNYKAQDAAIRHVGPTAQDFRAAFGLGDFPLRINTIDADGVALAAVKALESRTRRLNETLQRENDALRARLERLEGLLRK